MIISALVDDSVDTIRFDYAVRMEMQGGSSIRLGQPFSIRFEGDDEITEVTPEELDSGSWAVLGLLRREVLDAQVTASGTLSLRFSGGALLSCSPHPDYEAWQVQLATGEMVLSTPGGEVASWGAPLD